jgi:RecA-family ATPase
VRWQLNENDPEVEAARERYRQSQPNGTDRDEPFAFTVAASLAGITPPERPWLVQDWLPCRQVTLLSGDGGVGKSLLAMQLMASLATDSPWLGLPTTWCRSFAVFAEDDEDELHRRIDAIARAENIDISQLDAMAWRCAVTDPCELVEIDDRGRLLPTAYYHQLEAAVKAFGARLVVLDAATNLYGGDEVKRRQVNAFVGLLRRLAIEIDGAVLLLAHPSAQGISTGSGLSGSTHWNNSVRSRLYFVRSNEEDADPDERTLTRLKANYAGPSDVIRVRWDKGAFTAIEAPSGIDRAAINSKADRVFMELLTATYTMGSWCSASLTARNYAPHLFAKHPDREHLAKPHFEAAMHRLLKVGRIKTEPYGSPSQNRSRLAPS